MAASPKPTMNMNAVIDPACVSSRACMSAILMSSGRMKPRLAPAATRTPAGGRPSASPATAISVVMATTTTARPTERSRPPSASSSRFDARATQLKTATAAPAAWPSQPSSTRIVGSHALSV